MDVFEKRLIHRRHPVRRQHVKRFGIQHCFSYDGIQPELIEDRLAMPERGDFASGFELSTQLADNGGINRGIYGGLGEHEVKRAHRKVELFRYCGDPYTVPLLAQIDAHPTAMQAEQVCKFRSLITTQTTR